MNTINNLQDLIENINANNPRYEDNQFDTVADFQNSATKHFSDYCDDCEIEFDGCKFTTAKTETYFDDETQNTLTVTFCVAEHDADIVGESEKIYGFVITGN